MDSSTLNLETACKSAHFLCFFRYEFQRNDSSSMLSSVTDNVLLKNETILTISILTMGPFCLKVTPFLLENKFYSSDSSRNYRGGKIPLNKIYF